jgi:hypothetical protein
MESSEWVLNSLDQHAGNVMLLNVWVEDQAEVDLPPPEALCIEKEVTGLMEYSLFYLSKAEEGVTSAPSSPQKKARESKEAAAAMSELDLD